MKLISWLMLTPLCSTPALAAPEVHPLGTAVEQKALPSANSPLPRASAIQRLQVIQRPAQHETLPTAITAPPVADKRSPAKDESTPPPLLANPPSQSAKSPHRRQPPPPQNNPSEGALASRAIGLYEAKDYAAALTILKQLKPFYTQTKDAGMTSLIGFAALETGENQLALDSFYQAAEWTDDEEYWLFLVDARIRLGQVEEAQKILDGLPQSKERDQRIDALLGLRAAKAFDSGQPALAEQMLLESKTPLSAGNLELLGWTQLRQDKLNAASASFEASYRKKPSSGAAQGLAFSHQRLKSTDKLIALADSLKGSLVDLSNDPAVREQIATGNLARISVNGQGQLVLDAASAYTPPSPGVTITVGPSYRHRNGDNGQGKLDVTGISVLGEWVGATDRVNVKLDQFIADNGATRQSSMNSPYALWRHRTDDDLELSLGLGISPTGGELPAKPIGEMGIASYAAKNGWNARLFRQSNLESILAMSGSYQANTPLGASATWGQVLEEGITLGGYVTLLEDWKTEGTLTAARITGVGVADNSKIAFWGRALRPISGLDGWRVGADMYTSSFDKNLSYYTPGFGGYYSPQFSLNLGPAVAYEQQLGQVKINAYASLGWGYVTQASADGNPLTGTDPGKYPSSSSSGLATHLDLDAQLPLGRNWTLGLNLGGLSSPGYEEWRARLYASHNF